MSFSFDSWDLPSNLLVVCKILKLFLELLDHSVNTFKSHSVVLSTSLVASSFWTTFQTASTRSPSSFLFLSVLEVGFHICVSTPGAKFLKHNHVSWSKTQVGRWHLLFEASLETRHENLLCHYQQFLLQLSECHHFGTIHDFQIWLYFVFWGDFNLGFY